MPGPDPTATVKMPALLLLIVGAIGVAFSILGILLAILGVGMGAIQGGDQGMMSMVGGGVGIVFRIIFTILQCVICFGAFKMGKLQSYGLAMTAAVIAVIPCVSPCCVVGIPFGIWALIVLMKPEVKAAFH
jgi:hypothetical protein